MDAKLIRSFLEQTTVLRSPRRALSTFGTTTTRYHLISPVDGMLDKTRLREGKVLSEKPQILTAESLKERFEGFGEEAGQFADWISSSYRDLLRALEYTFKNQGFNASMLSEKPQLVADRITAELDGRGAADEALIRCPDAAWSLALMKFTLDETARSFPVNVQDLERRDLFNPDPADREVLRRRREIEALFTAAASNRALVKELGKKLHDYGLFKEYEDRYLSFF
jgi:hypothetical protein